MLVPVMWAQNIPSERRLLVKKAKKKSAQKSDEIPGLSDADYEALKHFKPDLKCLSLTHCHDRGIYALVSRHLRIGLYISEYRCFIGIRNDNGVKYLYTEQHWDVPEPYGVARPYKLICDLPENINYTHECECFAKLHLNDELFGYLSNLKETDDGES